MQIQHYTNICVTQATHMHDLSTSYDFQNLTPLSLSEVGVPATSELFPATSELRARQLLHRTALPAIAIASPSASSLNLPTRSAIFVQPVLRRFCRSRHLGGNG